MQSKFDNLRGGTRSRIAEMRVYVRRWNDNPRHSTCLASFREARRHGVGKIDGRTYGTGKAQDGKTLSVAVSVVDAWRSSGKAHDIVRMRHTGWYVDAEGSETIEGEVWQLPARNGSPRYVAGFRDGESGYCVLDASRGNVCLYDSADDAARAADALAESEAGQRREYDERLREAESIRDEMDEKKDEARAARADAKRYIHALRQQMKAGDVADAVRELMAGMIRDHRAEASRAWSEARDLSDKLDATGMRGDL